MGVFPRFLLILGLAACGQLCVPEGPREGLRGPSIEAALVDGGHLSSAELEDKPTLLVFWASWCGPCMAEVPYLKELQAGVGDTVHIVGINGGESRSRVESTMRRMDMTWPVALDLDGQIQREWEVQSIPLVVILDRDWRVRYRGNGLPLRVHALLQGLSR